MIDSIAFGAGPGLPPASRGQNITGLTSANYLKLQEIKTGAVTPYGIQDLAFNGNWLAFTATTQPINLIGIGDPASRGNLHVVDTGALKKGPDLTSTRITVDLNKGTTGKAPLYVIAGSKAGEFIVGTAKDANSGLNTVEFTVDKGQYSNPQVHNTLLRPTDTGWLEKKHQQNIQRANGIVEVTYQGEQYALIADYNFVFNDAHYASNDLLGKQIGGKIGIVKDPFGEAIYLGATTPMVGGSIDKLSLGQDGKTLLGSVLLEEMAPAGSDYYSRTYQALLKWDVDSLIRAALETTDKTIPIDLTRSGNTYTPKPGVQPQKFDGALPGDIFNNNFGWIYGVHSGSRTGVTSTGPVRFGDIGTIDIYAELKARIPEYANLSRADFSDFDLSDGAVNGVRIVRGPETKGFWGTPQNGEIVSSKAGARNAVAEASNVLFSESGILYVAPKISDDMLALLRSGERLADRTANFTVDVTVKGERHTFTIFVDLVDFGDTQDRVFFGDRALDNPGYSAFTLQGEVGVGKANNPLDVWRVEQRLKYLGFPAMYTGSQPTVANNTLQNFEVDGQFKAEEQAALKLFEKVVRYGYGHRNFANENGTADNSNGADGMIEASTNDPHGDGRRTTDWLSAYNAPHWMQFFESTPGGDYPYATSNPSLPGWENRQRGDNPTTTAPTNIELYGTSWVYDLMAAAQFAPAALRGDPVYDAQGNITGYTPRNTFWFNGATDANYGFTPLWNPQNVIGQHQTHDLGMAFDLGVTGYIFNGLGGAQNNPNEQLLPSVITAVNDVVVPWSLDAALNYSAQLPHIVATPTTLGNDQLSAMRDFMSLYAVTQSNTWGEMSAHVVNGTQARDALFGAGTQTGGMITQVVIGGTGSKNPYPNMRKVLSGLGISNNYNASGHQTHFHVFLNVPTLKAITGTGYLLTDNPADSVSSATSQTDAQALQDYTNNLIEGEELMFIMDVPYIPAQETPIVLAQAATPGATPQPDYILTGCQETESTGNPSSALRTVDPAGWLALELGNRSNRDIYNNPAALASIKTTLLQGTTHGKITSVIDNTGRPWYRYDATPNYIGNDKAVFQAEFEGKVYKIVLELHVFRGGVPGEFGASTCPEPTLIKVNGKPVSGALGSDINVSVMDSLTIDASAITVTFDDLEGGAVGQAVGNTITLDPTAAGYNWLTPIIGDRPRFPANMPWTQ